MMGAGFWNMDKQQTLELLSRNPSIGHTLAEIENHVHSNQQLFGGTSASNPTIVRMSTQPIVVTGGNNVFGTELVLHPGTVIEGGSSTARFDLNNIRVSAVGATNNITVKEMLTWAPGTQVPCSFVTGTDKLHIVATTLANNDKIWLPTIASNTGINVYTVYYVINKSVDDVELSLTRGGAKVDITGPDGAGTYEVVGTASDATGYATGQEVNGQDVVFKAAATSDSVAQSTQMKRKPCNYRMSCRMKATGATNAVSFFINLHTYIGG